MVTLFARHKIYLCFHELNPQNGPEEPILVIPSYNTQADPPFSSVMLKRLFYLQIIAACHLIEKNPPCLCYIMNDP